MSGPQRPGGAPDELGLAEVAWRLRTTLAEAGDVSVAGNETVLSTIRRRSTQRRRAKRVMGTSVAAFALSICTLAVVKGGQVAIDHNLAGNKESPAVTLGAQEPDDETPVADPTTTPDEGASPVVAPGECTSGEPQTCGTSTSPTTMTSGEVCTGPGHCTTPNPNDPTSSAGGNRPTSPGPSNARTNSTAPPTSTPAPTTLPPTTKPTAVMCGTISPAETPSDPECFQRAFDSQIGADLLLITVDPITGVENSRGIRFRPGIPISIQPTNTSGSAPPIQQCARPRYVGAPTWYEFDGCIPL